METFPYVRLCSRIKRHCLKILLVNPLSQNQFLRSRFCCVKHFLFTLKKQKENNNWLNYKFSVDKLITRSFLCKRGQSDLRISFSFSLLTKKVRKNFVHGSLRRPLKLISLNYPDPCWILLHHNYLQ